MIDPSLLLHIGPHKTGTTAVQGAFHLGRAALAQYGIRYAGPTRQPFRAVLARVGSAGPVGQPGPDPALWEQLVEEIAIAPEPRVVLSSEAFAGADEQAVGEIVTELDALRRLHVVVTLRPLAKIVPSQWQQLVQNGHHWTYDRWLAGVFNDADDRAVAPTFWRRHDHPKLVARWLSRVGPDKLTVVVVDDADRSSVLRSFEAILDLPRGLLESPPDLANRSLTWAEAELMRQVNVAARQSDWPEIYFGRVLHSGAVDAMKKERVPADDEPRIPTPRWALERAAAVGAETVDVVRSSGVRVIGDLSLLARIPADPALIRAAEEPTVQSIPIDAAALAVLGAVYGMERVPKKKQRKATTEGEPAEPSDSEGPGPGLEPA